MIASATRTSQRRHASGSDKKSYSRISTRQREALQLRLEAIQPEDVKFIDNDHFHDPEAEEMIGTGLPEGFAARDGKPARVSRDLSATLARLCEMPLLEPAEEQDLFRRMNFAKFRAAHLLRWADEEDPDADVVEAIEFHLEVARQIRDRIVRCNGRLVVSIVRQLANAQNGFDDLVSEGVVALMRAVENFDYDRGFRFSTYATRAIRSNLFRLISKSQKQRHRYVTGSTEALQSVTDEGEEPQISVGQWRSLGGIFAKLLEKLDPREQSIVKARFGMDADKPKTLQRLADEMGVCKERVRQLEKRALKKLRDMTKDLHLEEFDVTRQ